MTTLTPDQIWVPIEELTCATGLTKRQVNNDIRAGLLPGDVIRGQARMRRADWNAYVDGSWQPEHRPKTKAQPPVAIHRIERRERLTG